MIASLSGRLKHRDAGRVVIETGGVGYEVSIPLATYYRLPSLGAPVSLEIRQVVREDSLTLYGFFTRAGPSTRPPHAEAARSASSK